MKKLLLPLLLLSVIAFAGCSNNGFTGGHNENLLKQQHCETIADGFVNYLSRSHTGDAYVLRDAFQSTGLNTCIVWVVRISTGDDNNFFIADYYKKSQFKSPDGVYWWKEADYDSKIKEMKWE